MWDKGFIRRKGNRYHKYIFIGLCLIYLNESVATANGIVSSRKMQIPASSLLPVAGSSYSENSPPFNQQSSQNHQNHSPNYSTNPLKLPFTPSEPYSWRVPHNTDPRMNLFFIDSSTGNSHGALKNKHSQLPLGARPRSLPKFPSKVKREVKLQNTKNMRSAKENNEKTASSYTNDNIKSKSKTEVIAAETSRTFVLTPLLASLVPIFVAQMFGMGMIPAAALITLPIFLLPIAMTAAVFLI